MAPSTRPDSGAEDHIKPRIPNRQTRSWLLGVAALATLAVLVAACGGGSNKTSVGASASQTTTATTSRSSNGNGNGNRSAQRQAFNQCMQSHGVNSTNLRGLGGFRGGGNATDNNGTAGPSTSFTLPPGVSQQQFQAAFQACRSLLPNGGNFQNNPAFAAYRNCLQLHGVTLGTGPGQRLDPTNPTVQSALQACAALRPRSSTTSSTPPPTT